MTSGFGERVGECLHPSKESRSRRGRSPVTRKQKAMLDDDVRNRGKVIPHIFNRTDVLRRACFECFDVRIASGGAFLAYTLIYTKD